jgi:hypothetical protein
MRVLNLITVSVAAGLVMNAVASAAETPARGEGASRKTEVIQTPALPWNVQGGQGTSLVSADPSPAPHWTAFIGSGAASAVNAGLEKAAVTPQESGQRSPDTDWTSAIGTGTAAALESRVPRAGGSST